MDIFSRKRSEILAEEAPLADRMRPRTLDEFEGQEEILASGKLLYRAIMADRLGSMIFYGPAGSGKTTLARIIANTTKRNFKQINAVMAGVKDIKAVIAEAEAALGERGERTILFIDEIHRFNKLQQDALLPSVERGIITLIGATTENPYFEVNSPLLSRSQIFEFRKLNDKDISRIIERAVLDEKRGFGKMNIVLRPEALQHWAKTAEGDARIALNALELAVLTTEPDDEGVIVIDLEVAEESIRHKAVRYDKDGDNHYDTISAFIKSIRGSDPDAAVYYLARMLEAGEDMRFIARRIVISASEDVGNANPQALVVANAAAQACDFVGLPEAAIILAQAVTYLASSPKSNRSYMSLVHAQNAVRNEEFSGIPDHLRDTHYGGAAKLGRGKDYLYPHDYPGNYIDQQYLPDSLVGNRFYIPTENGQEARLAAYLAHIRKERNKDE